MDVNQVHMVFSTNIQNHINRNEEDFSCSLKVLLMRGFYHDNADSLHE